ncbi:glycosyltransferase family 4 protein [Candidatus Micrarchaeota archaeon]|nr:glycosyltransferase family 4 protein [Candidatus Micrarchaeota archaeon]
MKVLFAAPNFLPLTNGAAVYLHRICVQLKKLGHEPVVFTSAFSPKEKDSVTEVNGIKVYSSGFLFRYSNTPVNFWSFPLKKVIEKEKPDIIVGSVSNPFMADSVSGIAEKKSIPFFLVYYNDYIKQSFFEKFFVWLYYSFFLNKTANSSNKIIALSDYYIKKSFFLGRFPEKTVSVPPFADLSEFSFREPLKEDFSKNRVILFVGALNKGQKYKGLSCLIKAVSLLKKSFPEIKLVVVGEGNNSSYFKELAFKAGIKENVFFVGSIPKNKLAFLYSSCEALVLPSESNAEGFGLVLLEAMLFSKPVIAGNSGGIPALVKNNFNGLLVEPGNEIKLAKAIEFILSDKKKAKKLGKNALITAKSFSPEKSINKLVSLFEEALNEKTK